jgi:hypothetical protein
MSGTYSEVCINLRMPCEVTSILHINPKHREIEISCEVIGASWSSLIGTTAWTLQAGIATAQGRIGMPLTAIESR